MHKHPLSLKSNDIKNLLLKPIIFEIGPPHNDEVTNQFKGKIVDCKLASNNENLPVHLIVELENKSLQIYSICEIKRIYELE